MTPKVNVCALPFVMYDLNNAEVNCDIACSFFRYYALH